jgi:hypothetical protein
MSTGRLMFGVKSDLAAPLTAHGTAARVLS